MLNNLINGIWLLSTVNAVSQQKDNITPMIFGYNEFDNCLPMIDK